jgi:alkanesulfonate monooxygenase SsuD/methylene tetrahydromethanopterin reductase-like flavin-dependent oxidoreductase (luciferase family)
VGGGGEKVTLRMVAAHADAWNTFGPPDTWAHKNRVLDDWCEKVGRDPGQIERTVAIEPNEVERVEEYAEVGVEHVIVMLAAPFDLGPVLEAKARLAT